jgi:hypothetical protein
MTKGPQQTSSTKTKKPNLLINYVTVCSSIDDKKSGHFSCKLYTPSCKKFYRHCCVTFTASKLISYRRFLSILADVFMDVPTVEPLILECAGVAFSKILAVLQI